MPHRAVVIILELIATTTIKVGHANYYTLGAFRGGGGGGVE